MIVKERLVNVVVDIISLFVLGFLIVLCNGSEYTLFFLGVMFWNIIDLIRRLWNRIEVNGDYLYIREFLHLPKEVNLNDISYYTEESENSQTKYSLYKGHKRVCSFVDLSVHGFELVMLIRHLGIPFIDEGGWSLGYKAYTVDDLVDIHPKNNDTVFYNLDKIDTDSYLLTATDTCTSKVYKWGISSKDCMIKFKSKLSFLSFIFVCLLLILGICTLVSTIFALELLYTQFNVIDIVVPCILWILLAVCWRLHNNWIRKIRYYLYLYLYDTGLKLNYDIEDNDNENDDFDLEKDF